MGIFGILIGTIIAIFYILNLNIGTFFDLAHEREHQAFKKSKVQYVDMIKKYEEALSIPFFDAIIEEDLEVIEELVDDHLSSGIIYGFNILDAGQEPIYNLTSAEDSSSALKMLQISNSITKELKAIAKTGPITQVVYKIEEDLSRIVAFRRFGQHASAEGWLLTAYDIKEFTKIHNDLVEKSYQFNEISSKELMYLGLTAIAAVTIVSLVCLWFLRKSIIEPILELNQAAADIALGNYKVNINSKSRDEIGSLASSFNTMSTSLDKAFTKINDYKQNLEEKVEQRTEQLKEKQAKIENILNNLNEGILTFDDNMTILEDFSPYLETIFEVDRKDIAGEDALNFLLQHAHISGDKKDMIASALLFSIGGNKFGWDINYHTLPQNIIATIHDKEKHLDLDWTPILKDEIVDSIMLTVRDLTEKVRLQEQIKHDQAKHSMFSKKIEEIVKARPSWVREFIINGLEQSRSLVAMVHENFFDTKEVFIILHTLKGNARIHNFNTVADLTHTLETYLFDFQKSGDNGIKNMLSEGVENLIHELSEYNEVLTNFFPDSRVLNDLYEVVASIVPDTNKMLDERLGRSIDSFNVSDKILNWDSNAIVLMREIIIHLITNGVDHGFRDHSADKSVEFSLKMTIDGDLATLVFSDNGCGLNEQKLIELAQKRNYRFEGANQLYNIIFEDGSSTQEHITNTSGRGVGLAAVKSKVNELNGQIAVSTKNQEGTIFTMTFPISNLAKKHELEVLPRQAS